MELLKLRRFFCSSVYFSNIGAVSAPIHAPIEGCSNKGSIDSALLIAQRDRSMARIGRWRRTALSTDLRHRSIALRYQWIHC